RARGPRAEPCRFAARSKSAGRRSDTPDRGKAAADSHRAAEGGQRRGDDRRLCRRAQPAVQSGAGQRSRSGRDGRRVGGVVVRPRRIGTRGSALALWQARTGAARLHERGTPTEIVVIKTGGDRLQEAPLSEAGGKRLFVKELEDALLSGDIDLAVHSAKDMSAVLADGLTLWGV